MVFLVYNSRMNILYCGISSKYVHTMPAGWFLCEYLSSKGIKTREIYHNVNEPYEKLKSNIIGLNPDVLLLSVYIFNVNLINQLVKDLKNTLKGCKIIVGGPEVDEKFINADHIIIGEGEKALYKLITEGGDRIVYQDCFIDLDEIPSPYTNERLQKSDNKLIYYESSRGCPFRCSYCMASLSKGVRYFSIERVKEDLKRIVDHGCKIIKFTDRTFNACEERTNAILTYILQEFYNKKVCFHFEVGGDLFKQSTLDILRKMPVGLVQMEAGVQTLNPPTLKAINREFKKENFLNNIKEIISYGSIHMHLDLIAGLPFDSMETFILSLDEVMELRPHNLQLGFLKMLKGTPIRESYQAEYSSVAPYEIISSPLMSEKDLLTLKNVEFALNRLYNSGKFRYTLEYLFSTKATPFEVFLNLSAFFQEKGIAEGAYEWEIYNAMAEYMKDMPMAKDYLRFDYLITNNSKKVPACLKSIHAENFKKFLSQHKRTVNVMYEIFNFLPFKKLKGSYIIKFDYSAKNPVNGQYSYELL